MSKIRIIFEGATFVVEVGACDINVTNEIILPVDAQMHFHLKQSLVREIEDNLKLRTIIFEAVESDVGIIEL